MAMLKRAVQLRVEALAADPKMEDPEWEFVGSHDAFMRFYLDQKLVDVDGKLTFEPEPEPEPKPEEPKPEEPVMTSLKELIEVIEAAKIEGAEEAVTRAKKAIEESHG